jgi:hypothetical protein
MGSEAAARSADGLPSVALLPDGIVEIDYHEIQSVTVKTVQHTHHAQQRLAPGRVLPLLIRAGNVLHADRAALDYAVSEPVAACIRCVAVVEVGFMVRHLARMFIWYHRPPYRVSLFPNEAEAREWLRSYAA